MRLILSLSALSGFNLLISLLTQWYVLVTLGPGAATDALFASSTLPQMVLAVVSGSLVYVLVPLLTNDDDDQLRRDFWTVFFVIIAFFGILALGISLTADRWVPLLFPGFSRQSQVLTIVLSRVQSVSMVLTGVFSVLEAVYHARQRFVWPQTTPLLGSAAGLIMIFWALPHFGILVVAWVSVFSLLLQSVLLLPGIPNYHKPDWRGNSIKIIWQRLIPLLAGSTYYKAEPLVDRFLSSMTSVGSLSLLYLGQQLYGIYTSILNAAIASPMVPVLSGCAKAQKWTEFRRVYRRKLKQMILLTGSCYVGLLVVGNSVLNFLVGHGQVTRDNLSQLWLLLVALVGLLIGGALGQILSSAFYAKGDTSTPTKIGVLGFTLGIGLKVWGFSVIGLTGIALGTTVYYFFNMLVLFVLLERDMRHALSARDLP